MNTSQDTRPQFADVVTDKQYEVLAYPGPEGCDVVLGGLEYDLKVVGIIFYTGFAGCPSRYYVTRLNSDTGRTSTYTRFAQSPRA